MEESPPLYEFKHTFACTFYAVARAYWGKYKEQNSYSTITLADVKQAGDNEFSFVRRIEGRGRVEHEAIRYRRDTRTIFADLFVKGRDKVPRLSERCTHQGGVSPEQRGVEYTLRVYSDVWGKFIRRRAFSWGVHRMESMLKRGAKTMCDRKPDDGKKE